MENTKPIIAMEAPVSVLAGESDGDKKGPAKFDVTAYTGIAMELNGWDLPVVVDLEGLEYSNSVIANLDHEAGKRVGHVTEKEVVSGQLRLKGIASAATPFRDEVVKSAAEGFAWQASVEVRPITIEEVPTGKTATANGREFSGPLYITRSGRLSAFAFVSHGADDFTTAQIAATADKPKEKKMETIEAGLKTFIEEMLPGTDIEALSSETISSLKANYEGKNGKKPNQEAQQLGDLMQAKEAEHSRVQQITKIACEAVDNHPYNIDAIKVLAERAIDQKWSVDKFRLEYLEATVPAARAHVTSSGGDRLNGKVLEAAICQTARLEGHEKMFDDQTLQAAHDRFRHGIGLQQLFKIAAESNGYRCQDHVVDVNVQRAAFGMAHDRRIQASTGFSTFSLPNTLSNVANKFIREGWMHVDQAWSKISTIKSVSDFKQTTTVSLTGGLVFEELGPTGEIKHGTVGEETYNNQADTYAKMFAITRKDIINDDLGALTAIPRRLGRGGALKLNDLFWSVFLNNSSFFTSGRANVSTDTGALGLVGLDQANTIFMNQTDPDGTPLGSMPKILLVPTALESTARQLMNSERLKGDTDEGDANVWRGRFEVVSSPYMSNSSYTGYSAVAWYLLADPNDIPVIEIAALNGRVEPTVDTADADFNTLGVQMRGYSDVGVALQEYRGGVRADGSAAD